MSTRANVILKDGNRELFFYRHSDGYPEGTMPALEKFLSWLKSGKIRNNLSQGAGWLVIIGALEYQSIPKHLAADGDVNKISDPEDWKVGAFEPTTGIHGDVEYIYTVDLNKKEITVKEA